MADNRYAVESRQIDRCYVGRCGPLVIVSELPSAASIRFLFAALHGRLSISLSI